MERRDATTYGANARKHVFAADRRREAGRSREPGPGKPAEQARRDAMTSTTNPGAWATGGDRPQ
jgi:hypothetical protein